MVLDPMTGEEQEPQDLRIVIAHKVFSQSRFCWKRPRVCILSRKSGASRENLCWVLQRFLYTSQSLSDKDKGRLQKEILDTIFAESKLES